MNEDKTAVGHTDLKKLPDFEQLKKDAQIQNLKVVSFLKVIRYCLFVPCKIDSISQLSNIF